MSVPAPDDCLIEPAKLVTGVKKLSTGVVHPEKWTYESKLDEYVAPAPAGPALFQYPYQFANWSVIYCPIFDFESSSFGSGKI